jgi:chromosome segregation ATPase
LRFFNPNRFELDILGVDTKGLGRGKGTMVVGTYSVLDRPDIVEPIRKRCMELLGLIEGAEVPVMDELLALQADYEQLNHIVLAQRTSLGEARVKHLELEGVVSYWQGEAHRVSKLYEDSRAEIAGVEDNMLQWKRHSESLEEENERLKIQVTRLNRQFEGAIETKGLVVEEIDEILDMINSSANTDFEYLVDAVEFLLEGG